MLAVCACALGCRDDYTKNNLRRAWTASQSDSRCVADNKPKNRTRLTSTMRFLIAVAVACVCLLAAGARAQTTTTGGSGSSSGQSVYHELTSGSGSSSGAQIDAQASSSSSGSGTYGSSGASTAGAPTPVEDEQEEPAVQSCVWPPHYWLTHLSHEAWAALAAYNCTVCGLDCESAARGLGTPENYDAQGHEVVVQVVSAMLDALTEGCTDLDECVGDLAGELLFELAAQGCIGTELPDGVLGALTLQNNGAAEDGPCACTDFECVRYIDPQAVIDEQEVAVEKLSKTSAGFLAWAIVMTVLAGVLLLVLLFLALRVQWGVAAGNPHGLGRGAVGTWTISDDMSADDQYALQPVDAPLQTAAATGDHTTFVSSMKL